MIKARIVSKRIRMIKAKVIPKRIRIRIYKYVLNQFNSNTAENGGFCYNFRNAAIKLKLNPSNYDKYYNIYRYPELNKYKDYYLSGYWFPPIPDEDGIQIRKSILTEILNNIKNEN